MSYTAFIPGNGGVLAPVDNVGETAFSGTGQRSGTNGYTYSVRSTTNVTTTYQTVASITLNIGIYLFTYRSTVTMSVSDTFEVGVLIGGTSIQGSRNKTLALSDTAQNSNRANLIQTIPIVITANSTVVSLFAGLGPYGLGTASSSAHEIWAVRIA